MKKISKILVLMVLSVFVVSLFACFGSDGTASTGYLNDYDEEKIVDVIDSSENKNQITHSYSILTEKSNIKKLAEDFAKKDGTVVLYEYYPVDEDGNYSYVKLVLKVENDKVASFVSYIKEQADISNINVETIKIFTDVPNENIGYEKIDIEINAGSSKGSGSTSNIILYVFLGLIVAVIIGSSIYKFVKAKKAMKKQQEQPKEENTENPDENKGGDFFS